MEASISLPGRGDTEGFWPGFWSMGNLGRPGYASSTDGMWPYSYDNICDSGITPNQSSTDGLNWLPGMRLPACTCSNEDHPNPGVSRSAPELDVLEGSVTNLDPTNMIGVVSQSAQIAPFDIWYYPDYGRLMTVLSFDLSPTNAMKNTVPSTIPISLASIHILVAPSNRQLLVLQSSTTTGTTVISIKRMHSSTNLAAMGR